MPWFLYKDENGNQIGGFIQFFMVSKKVYKYIARVLIVLLIDMT